MMSNWNQATLEDVCVIITDGAHKSPKSVNEGEYMVSVKDFTEFGFDFANCKRISKQDYDVLEKQRCVPEIDDILVGKDGARYFEDIIIYKQIERPALLSSIAILRADKSKITPEFLYYTLKSPVVKKDVRENYGSGSAIPRIVLKDFRRMPISFPKLEEQKKITSLLKVIDDRIYINNRINKNLEKQAQTIFKQWFVDFEPFDGKMPCNWSFGTLEDLGKEIICGKTPPTKRREYYGGHIPFVTIPDMHNQVYITETERYLSNEGVAYQPTKTLPKNSVCVSCIGTAGIVSMISQDSQTNQQINSIVPKESISPFYVYFLMKSLSETIIRLGGSGSTIVNLNKGQFAKIEATIPSADTMSEFTNNISPFFELILSNQHENHKLSDLRDALLPQLMSGKIDVSSIEI